MTKIQDIIEIGTGVYKPDYMKRITARKPEVSINDKIVDLAECKQSTKGSLMFYAHSPKDTPCIINGIEYTYSIMFTVNGSKKVAIENGFKETKKGDDTSAIVNTLTSI